jgi:hypothetical protein
VFIYDQSDLNEPWLPTHRLAITDTGPLQPGLTASFGQGLAAWRGWIAVTASNAAANSDAVYTNPIVFFRNGFEPAAP